MTRPNPGNPENLSEANLPRRDWILLPILCLLTICFIAVSMEGIGTRMFPRAGRGLLNCLVLNDSSTGVRGVPNCVGWSGLPEGQQVEYRFNSCGHRAGMECGTKLPGVYRIVMVGSSFVFGDGVARQDSMAGQLGAQLSWRAGRKVELYNEGMGWGYPSSVDRRFKEAVAAHPDLILWPLTIGDVDSGNFDLPDTGPATAGEKGAAAPGKRTSFWAMAWGQVKAQFVGKSTTAALISISDKTRFVFLLRHILYQSQSLYVRSYLMGAGNATFLRTQTSTESENSLRLFDSYVADIMGQAKAAGVPVVAVLVPNRVQSAMISMGEWPDGFDPYALDHRLRAIFASHGADYVDILPGFRDIPNPELNYFPVDGHPNANGHAIIANLLARELTNGSIPALRSVTPQRVSSVKGQ
jgi:hypothetical protein